MKKTYLIGVKKTTTKYYQVIAENEFKAQEIAEEEGDFIESEPDKYEAWVDEEVDAE